MRRKRSRNKRLEERTGKKRKGGNEEVREEEKRTGEGETISVYKRKVRKEETRLLRWRWIGER